MLSRRGFLVWTLATSPVWLPGCGDYDHDVVPNNDNVPELVITQEMLDEMRNKEAERC